jgi:hypothetical protein
MKPTIIALCLTLTLFAQEEHENFTIEQRTGTLGMNIIPGLGSIVIMDDWAGAGIQWILTGAGIALVADIVISSRDYVRNQEDDLDGFLWHDNNLLKAVIATYIFGLDILFNITRSVTYDNPKYVQQSLEKNGNKNFTIGQRFGTFGMNIIPGLGSIVVMDDWGGAITQWVLVGSGIASIDSFGPVLICFDILFNIYRSATYNNLKNATSSKNEGFHLSVLPNRYGKVMPYLVFSKGF